MEVFKKIFVKYPVILLFLLISAQAFVMTKLIFFPYPEIFLMPYFTNNGMIPYKEIIDQHPPGLFFFPINFGTLGLTSVETARIWLIATTLIIQLMIYFIAKAITKDPKKALSANFIFFIWHHFFGGWVLWIDSFIPLMLLPAFYFTYEFLNSKDKRNYQVVLIGLFLSLSLLFKQTNVLVAIGVFALLIYHNRSWRVFNYFLLGFLPLNILMVIYLIKLGALTDFVQWGIIFNLAVYALSSKKGAEYPSYFQYIFSFSPILLFWYIKNYVLKLLLVIFALGTFIGLTDRFDAIHLQPALPFLAIGTVLVFNQIIKLRRFRLYIVIYILLSLSWIWQAYSLYIANEVIVYNDSNLRYCNKIKQYVSEKEEIYLFGIEALCYYETKTLPAGKVFVFNVPWNMPLLEDMSIKILRDSKVKLIARDRTFVTGEKPIIVFAKKLDKYIDENYVVFDKLDNLELLKLRPQNEK